MWLAVFYLSTRIFLTSINQFSSIQALDLRRDEAIILIHFALQHRRYKGMGNSQRLMYRRCRGPRYRSTVAKRLRHGGYQWIAGCSDSRCAQAVFRRLRLFLGADNDLQIHIYDEGAQNGSTIPYVQNYNQLNESISASAYGGGGVTNVTYDVVFTFHTCHRIALRWQENAVTTAHVGYGRYHPLASAPRSLLSKSVMNDAKSHTAPYQKASTSISKGQIFLLSTSRAERS